MDPIANMFTQLKNAGFSKNKETKLAYSKMKIRILEILKNMGIISDFKVEKNDNQKYPQYIVVNLRFKNNDELAFSDINRVSRPGRRVYISANRIKKASHDKTEILISTSSGIMSGTDARKKGLGGEVICEVR